MAGDDIEDEFEEEWEEVDIRDEDYEREMEDMERRGHPSSGKRLDPIDPEGSKTHKELESTVNARLNSVQEALRGLDLDSPTDEDLDTLEWAEDELDHIEDRILDFRDETRITVGQYENLMDRVQKLESELSRNWQKYNKRRKPAGDARHHRQQVASGTERRMEDIEEAKDWEKPGAGKGPELHKTEIREVMEREVNEKGRDIGDVADDVLYASEDLSAARQLFGMRKGKLLLEMDTDKVEDFVDNVVYEMTEEAAEREHRRVEAERSREPPEAEQGRYERDKIEGGGGGGGGDIRGITNLEEKLRGVHGVGDATVSRIMKQVRQVESGQVSGTIDLTTPALKNQGVGTMNNVADILENEGFEVIRPSTGSGGGGGIGAQTFFSSHRTDLSQEDRDAIPEGMDVRGMARGHAQSLDPDDFSSISIAGFLGGLLITGYLAITGAGFVLPVSMFAFGMLVFGQTMKRFIKIHNSNHKLSDLSNATFLLSLGISVIYFAAVIILVPQILAVLGIAFLGITATVVGFNRRAFGLALIGVVTLSAPLIIFLNVIGVPNSIIGVVFSLIVLSLGTTDRVPHYTRLYEIMTLTATGVWGAAIVTALLSVLSGDVLSLKVIGNIATAGLLALFMFESSGDMMNIERSKHIFQALLGKLRSGTRHGTGFTSFLSIWQEIGGVMALIGIPWALFMRGFLPGINATLLFLATLFLLPANLYYFFKSFAHVMVREGGRRVQSRMPDSPSWGEAARRAGRKKAWEERQQQWEGRMKEELVRCKVMRKTMDTETDPEQYLVLVEPLEGGYDERWLDVRKKLYDENFPIGEVVGVPRGKFEGWVPPEDQ